LGTETRDFVFPVGKGLFEVAHIVY
jgi:hypothetical protein